MNKQGGMTLIGAIFIVVIVSLLGQYLVKITSVQRQTGTLALQAARAYQAANAGMEWGIDRVVNSSSCIASTTLSPAISNFTTTVSCNQLGSYSEAADTINVYRITTLSEYGSYGLPDYSSRRIQTIIHN